MFNRHFLAVPLVWLTGAPGLGHASEVTVSVSNEGNLSQHAIAVRAGETFSVDVSVSTTVEIFDLYDMKLLAGSAGVLTVTGGLVHAPWTNPGVLPIGALDPQSAGLELVLPYPDYFGPGESTLLTLDLKVSRDAAPGTLTLNVIDGQWTLCRTCPSFSAANSGPDFSVEVLEGAPVPTLSTWGLTVLAMLILVVGTVALKRTEQGS